jgi:hypothetical protein
MKIKPPDSSPHPKYLILFELLRTNGNVTRTGIHPSIRKKEYDSNGNPTRRVIHKDITQKSAKRLIRCKKWN